ncbi:MAG: ABC transporter permease [Methanomicrobiales archaeon]|nr:ABC transporter permease [Methanomicrobiales archaeon]
MIRGAGAIFKRDFKKFISNPFVLIFTLFMPIMYLIVFGNAMGGAISHIPLGVVQGEPYVTETPLYTAAVEDLRYLHDRDKPPLFDIIAFPDEDLAKRSLAEGKIMGVVVFPSELVADRNVRVYLDSSEYMMPTLMESGVTGAVSRAGGTNPIEVNPIYGRIEYLQFFGVGVIVMAIFMTTMMGGGIALIRDREMGIIEGYLVTPVKRSSIILGTIASGSVRAFLAGFVIFMVDIFIAGVIVRSMENFFLVLLVLFIVSVGITSLVVSFASRFSNQQEYASTVAFLNLVLFMTSGAFYPLLGMPGWLRWISVINPEAYAIHALRSIILRGQGLDVIGIDLFALILFCAGAIIVGIATYRRTLE